MVTVRIPLPLQVYTGGEDLVAGEGRNIRQLILNLDGRYPGIKAALQDGDRLKPHVKAVINGQIAQLGILTPVENGVEVVFIPAVSGG
jgi:molybdopterin converting factor small subunit